MDYSKLKDLKMIDNATLIKIEGIFKENKHKHKTESDMAIHELTNYLTANGKINIVFDDFRSDYELVDTYLQLKSLYNNIYDDVNSYITPIYKKLGHF